MNSKGELHVSLKLELNGSDYESTYLISKDRRKIKTLQSIVIEKMEVKKSFHILQIGKI